MKRLPLLLFLAAAGCANSSAPAPTAPPAPQPPVALPTPTPNPPARMTPPVQTPAAAELASPELQPVAKFDLGGTFSHTYSLDLQVTPDGKRLAVAMKPTGGTPAVQVWEVSGTPRRLFESEQSYGGGAPAISPSGRRVVAHSKVYDVDSGKKLALLPGLYYSHAFFAGEDLVVTTSRSHTFGQLSKGYVTVWGVTANKDAGSFEVPDNRFTDAFPVKGGRELWLFQSANRCEIECWDTTTGKLLRTVKPAGISTPPTSSGNDCGVDPDGTVFATRIIDYTVYDGVTGAAVGGLPGSRFYGMTNALTLGGTRALAIAGTPVLVDWKSRRQLAALRGFAPNARRIQAVASADGKTAVAVSEQGQALVFDLTKLK